MIEQPRIRIGIVAYRSGNTLQQCIDAIADQTFQAFEAIVVNNDCPDECTQKINLPDDRFKIVESRENGGFAGGSNLALMDAQTEWVMTLNPDARLAPDALETFFRQIEFFPDHAMAGPTLIQASAPDRLDGVGDCLSIYGISWRGGYGQPLDVAPTTPCEVFSPCGAAALYRTETFQTAGGFDEEFFCYVEDVDLGLRLRGMGEKCVFLPDVKVLHIGSDTLGAGHDFIWFHSYRNTIWMLARSLPVLLVPIVLPLHFIAQSWLIWRNRRAVGHSARLRGFYAGIRGVISSIQQRSGPQSLQSKRVWPWLSRQIGSVATKKIQTQKIDA